MWRPIRGWQKPGAYPETEYQARHLYRNRHENGLAPAFAKVQGRVLFNPDKLDALLSTSAQPNRAA